MLPCRALSGQHRRINVQPHSQNHAQFPTESYINFDTSTTHQERETRILQELYY